MIGSNTSKIPIATMISRIKKTMRKEAQTDLNSGTAEVIIDKMSKITFNLKPHILPFSLFITILEIPANAQISKNIKDPN